MGELGILNIGAGDTKLTFDKSNPAEMMRSARIVRDMLRRGYALLVEVTDKQGNKSFTRVHDFMEDTAEYIIADGPTVTETEGQSDERDVEPTSAKSAEVARKEAPEKPGRGRRRVPASGTRGVAVARSAGG